MKKTITFEITYDYFEENALVKLKQDWITYYPYLSKKVFRVLHCKPPILSYPYCKVAIEEVDGKKLGGWPSSIFEEID